MDDRKCLTVIRCFYLALCPALTISEFIFLDPIYYGPDWKEIIVYTIFMAFLWIPWKSDWLAVRIVVTLLCLLIGLAVIDEAPIYECNLEFMTVYLPFMAFLWIPWKYDWLAVRIAITLLGTLVSFAMIDEMWQAVYYPSRSMQLQVMSLSACILDSVLIALSYVVPAVLVWIRFRYRVWVLSGAFLFWLCYACYVNISGTLAWG